MPHLRFDPEVSASCLDGHFPGRPVIPGVVLLDAAIAALGLTGALRIEQVKFLRPCLPGIELELLSSPRGDAIDLRIESAQGLMASARVRAIVASPAQSGPAPDVDPEP